MASLYSTLHQYPCSLQTIHPSFIVPSFQIYIHNIPFSFDMTSSNLYEQNMATGTGSPCGACKFLRRRCASDCVFAPYFSCDQGAARFAAIHKVFGASNVSKLLMHLPVADRCEAVVTIAYEAQARIKDQVYGCVAQIFALQQQVAILQAQVMQTKAQIAYGLLEVQSSQRNQNISEKTVPVGCTKRPHYSTDYYTNEGALMQEAGLKDEILSNQLIQCNKRFAGHNEIGDLQSLAFTMMNSSQS